MGETDITFRRLLRALPEPILRLAFPRRTLRVVGPLDASADRPRQRTADAMFRVRDGRAECAVHVEVERGWRPELPRRMFDYATAVHAATGLPTASVVILLRPGGRPPRSPASYRYAGLGVESLHFRYQVVPLYAMDARRMRDRLPPEGWPFVPAMRGADAPFVRGLAVELAGRAELPSERREVAQGLLYLVTAAILGQEAAKRIFHMESIIQSPGVQALIREWEEKGRTEGRTEGRAEGRTEGLCFSCLTVAAAKLGGPVTGLAERLATITSAEALEGLLRELSSAQDARAVRAILARLV